MTKKTTMKAKAGFTITHRRYLIVFNLIGIGIVCLKLMAVQAATHPRRVLVTPGTARNNTQTLDTLLPVPDGFKISAKVIRTGVDIVPLRIPGSASTKYKRRFMAVRVPDGMPRSKIQHNMHALARRAFTEGDTGIGIFVYYESDDIKKVAAGSLVFAPYGAWDETDRDWDPSSRIHPLADYRARYGYRPEID